MTTTQNFTQPAKTELNQRLVYALMSQHPQSFWARPTKEPKFFYSFKIGALYNTTIQQQMKISELPRTLRNEFSNILDIFAKETGIKFAESIQLPDKDMILITYGEFLNSAFGRCECMVYNKKDLIATKIKNIRFNPAKIGKLPSAVREMIFLHELFHALSLKHPSTLESDPDSELGYDYPSELKCGDSIMGLHYCQQLWGCLRENSTKEKSSKCVKFFPPKPYYSAEDLEAALEQNKRSLDPNYKTSYIAATIEPLYETALRAFVASFVKTLIEAAFVPLLIEKLHLKNTDAKKIAQGFMVLFENVVLGFSLNSILFSLGISLFLKEALHRCGMKENYAELVYNLTNGSLRTYLGDPTFFQNILCAATASGLGHQAAWKLIQKFPHMHSEPPDDTKPAKGPISEVRHRITRVDS
jgi:hypothetical protein